MSESPLQAGATFLGRYEIVRCIKSGGMGSVYEAIHLETRRRRALKVMLPSVFADPDLRARFRLEAIITADIETEHIVETFDAGVDPVSNAPFLVMELLRGEDLGGLIAKRGRLSEVETVQLMHQLALALDKTHAASIVHRDLKPDNLFIVRRDDGSPRLKVLDFGIAKIVAEGTRAQPTRSIGTPYYMAPEQIRGDAGLGPRADIYAVGHIVYTSLVGASYWEDEAIPAEAGVWPLVVKVMEGAKEAPTDRAARRGAFLPPAFDGWFARATAPAAEARFGTASEAVAALADALGVALPRASIPAPASAQAPSARASVPSPSGRLSSPASAASASAASSPAASLVPASSVSGSVAARSTPDAGSSQPAPSVEAPRRDTPAPSTSPSPGNGTMEPSVHPSMPVPVPQPARSAKGRLAAVWAASLLVVAILAVAVAKQAGGPSVGAASAPPTAAPTATQAPIASVANVAVPAPVQPSSAPVPAPTAAPTAAVSATASATTIATGKRRAGPTAPSATDKSNDCNPPYEIDSAGIRTRKPQCN